MQDVSVAFIGFGEAAQAFAQQISTPFSAYDRKTLDPTTREDKWLDFRRFGALGCETNADAIGEATLVLSLVTADQALAAARECARSLHPGAFYCDMNSVSPQTKEEAALVIGAAGGCYVDAAVMAPVLPRRRRVPMLLSGPRAATCVALLMGLGFDNVRDVAGGVGRASAIKMIRSVVVKGIEALSAECMMAAEAAGVRDEVTASLDASWPGTDWAQKIDYNLDRMMVHGVRRAAEMDEVVKTLEFLGTGATMSRGTAERQREIGRLGLPALAGLHVKLDLLLAASMNGCP